VRFLPISAALNAGGLELRCASFIALAAADVRFTPKSGHCRARMGCPLGAKSGLMHRSEVGRYSITSSARANNVAGIVTPTALDVF
jgi:hypothetical protein